MDYLHIASSSWPRTTRSLNFPPSIVYPLLSTTVVALEFPDCVTHLQFNDVLLQGFALLLYTHTPPNREQSQPNLICLHQWNSVLVCGSHMKIFNPWKHDFCQDHGRRVKLGKKKSSVLKERGLFYLTPLDFLYFILAIIIGTHSWERALSLSHYLWFPRLVFHFSFSYKLPQSRAVVLNLWLMTPT